MTRARPRRRNETTVSKQRLYEIIRAPLVTEKSTMASEHNQVVFTVPLDAKKPEIKIAVDLQSDLQTDVVVYRVGKLGSFETHRLELHPGTYTVVGTRDGYRDVRKRFTLRAGESPERSDAAPTSRPSVAN